MKIRKYAPFAIGVAIYLGAGFAALSHARAMGRDDRRPTEKALATELQTDNRVRQYARQAGQPDERSSEEGEDPVVARVNGTAITKSEVMAMMKKIEEKSGQAAAGPAEDLRAKAVNLLIFQELAYKKAKASNITVDEKQVDRAIVNLKTNMGGEEKYRKFLERERLTEEKLRVQVERSLTLEKIVSKEVVDKVVVPEERLREEYEKEKHRYATPEKVVVVDVVFFLKMDDEDSVRKAEEIRRKIEADAKKDPSSLPPDASYIVREIELNKEKNEDLYIEAKKLTQGEISGVFKGSDSLHVLKLIEHVPERQFTFEESKASLSAKLRRDAQKKRLREWEEELKKEATIELVTPEEGGRTKGKKGEEGGKGDRAKPEN